MYINLTADCFIPLDSFKNLLICSFVISDLLMDKTNCLFQCVERGNIDYIELGGAMDLDSNMLTSETICGHKSLPVESVSSNHSYTPL